MDPLESGPRLEALRKLREVLAGAILAAEPRELAPLARQMQLVLADIDLLESANTGGSEVDAVAARREARRAKAAGSHGA